MCACRLLCVRVNVAVLGVLAAVHVARAGFPVRMQHREFVNRYGLLAVNILQDAWAEAKKEHPDTPREQERAVARCVCVCDSPAGLLDVCYVCVCFFMLATTALLL